VSTLVDGVDAPHLEWSGGFEEEEEEEEVKGAP